LFARQGGDAPPPNWDYKDEVDDDWFGEGANDAPEEEGEDAEEKKRQLEAYMKGFGGYSSNPFLK
jgi:hypothetical protein